MTLLPTEFGWVLGTNVIISNVGIDFGKGTVYNSEPKPFGRDLFW